MNTDSMESVARAFVDLLQTCVPMAEVAKLNANQPNQNCCHSHNFVDANEVMAAAFVKAGFGEPDTQDNETRVLWCSAWDRAKKIIAEEYL